MSGTGVDSDVTYAKGVGPRLAPILNKMGILTIRDLLYHLPRRYEDRSNLPPIAMARAGQFVTVRGRILDFEGKATRRGGMVILKALITDGTGKIVLTWFNQPWIKKTLQDYDGEIIAFGQVKAGSSWLEINTPEFELLNEEASGEEFARIVPIYPLTEGLGQKTIRKAVQNALDRYLDEIEEPLPNYLRRAYNLPDIKESLVAIHRPTDEDKRLTARNRFVFEDFLYLQLALQISRAQVQAEIGTAFPITQLIQAVPPSGPTTSSNGLFEADDEQARNSEPLWDQIHRLLPFELTGAQKRVIGEIFSDMEQPTPMNRLVQGDVGSGKTAVASAAALAAIRCGYQVALMAPTEILAEQHFASTRRLFEPVGINVGLLVGRQGKREREQNLAALASGKVQLVVGTQALIQEHVAFHKLGLVIIDEQHRFGVLQRAALRQKGYGNPDVLVMTATPIPRTLTMTLFGDLDLSIIDELPPGRKPIKTHWRALGERGMVYEGIRKMIQEGQQVYVVCPMVGESDKMTAQAAEDLHYRLTTSVFPDYKVGLLHGQQKAKEKDEAMEKFRGGEFNLLVSTTVIEVGVDVPNASVMVVEDANRFGLSQLHQLRGRVGRGNKQSYCILIADAKNDDAQARMEIMVNTQDGFKIAEEDLRLRGPGEIAGTKQSGSLDFKIADLVQDGKMLEQARQAAIKIIGSDPHLTRPENAAMLRIVKSKPSHLALIASS